MQILKPNRPQNATVGEAKNTSQPSTNRMDKPIRANTITDQTRRTMDKEGVQIDENNVIVDAGDSADGHTTKVKTPMCLVNELARHNHVS